MPELRPWDRRPWPTLGDESDSATFEAVGRALSAWEDFEAALSLLFAMFVGNFNTKAGRRAYNAVRTFEGRAEMLRAASETYFHEAPNDVWQREFKEIFGKARNFSPRRNDIAHGIVQFYKGNPDGSLDISQFPAGYALYPSLAAYKDRNYDERAEYCYTSAELSSDAGQHA